MMFAAATAIILAGCTMKNNTVEESAVAAAGGKLLTYEIRSMGEFDAAKSSAERTCRAQYGAPAHYVDRIVGPKGDEVRFACTE